MKVKDGGILGQIPEQEYIILKEDDFVHIKSNKDKDDDVQIIIETYDNRNTKVIEFDFVSKEFLDKKERFTLVEKDNDYELMLIDDGFRDFLDQTKWEAEMDEKDPFWYTKASIGDIETKYGLKINFEELLKTAKSEAERVRLDRKNRGPTIENGRIVIGSVFEILRQHDPLFDEKVLLSCEVAKLEERFKNK